MTFVTSWHMCGYGCPGYVLGHEIDISRLERMESRYGYKFGGRDKMSNRKTIRYICFALILSAISSAAEAEDFTDAIHAYLQHRVEAEKRDIGIVVGIVDEHGNRIVSCGKLDNGTDQEVNGDTVFEIGSVTKTFTALLLQDMVEHGEMKLDDPVAKYLPKSVKMPTRNGKDITLLQLATHTSGLPTASVTWIPERADNPRADYTIERMYDFVSGYKLTRDPGAKYEYSTVGIALLGQAIALKAGKDYESLVVERICRPLKMDSTQITLTGELKDRFAAGHNYSGYAVPGSYWGALTAGAALRSTANDMLKFMSANLDLSPSGLTPLMEKTHVAHFQAHLDTDTGLDTDIALAWMITREVDGTRIIQHGGLTDGFIAFVCFDNTRRRGVVVLSNSQDFEIPPIGKFLLESEWQSDRRPTEAKVSSLVYDSCVGRYQQRHMVGTPSQPVIGIRREKDRLFARATGSKSWPVDVLLPPVAVELLPESENRFFERLSGRPVTFARDARGKVTGLTVQYLGKAISYDKISDAPPKALEPPKPHIAVRLDSKLLDDCVGRYEFAPNAAYATGMNLTIRREGGRLIGQERGEGEKVLRGAFDIYSESETSFFIKINGAQLTFIKNDKGEVTAVIQHTKGQADAEAKRLSGRP
jgi:serine-type D-Ala-D-Ala carboxypeptidase/endopeptidase